MHIIMKCNCLFIMFSPFITCITNWTPLNLCIDFIYVNSDRVEINSVDLLGPDDDVTTIVVEPYSSDHRGVVAKFVLPLAP